MDLQVLPVPEPTVAGWPVALVKPVPAVKVGVVLGGFGSPRQAKQRLGRILRKSARTTAVLYEVVCQETREALRSRSRRRSDAFPKTRRLRL